MTTLIIAVVVIGIVIAYFIARAPSRTVRLLEESQAKAKRTEVLTTLLANLSDLVEHTRLILEAVAQRPDLELLLAERELLVQYQASCESVLPGLEQASPLLDRYVKNHIAVIRYVLGESDPAASPSDRISNSLQSIYRFQAAQRSDHPIAVMERKLATGQSV
jgi:hypothetical protein